MKAEEKLDQEVDRLWQQMRYAYEHGGGHAGHLNNAWHTAMRLSKELRRLHNEVRVLTETLQRCKEVGNFTAECYRLDADRDEALLRQALDTLAYWLEHGETPGSHDMIQRTHDALQERLK